MDKLNAIADILNTSVEIMKELILNTLDDVKAFHLIQQINENFGPIIIYIIDQGHHRSISYSEVISKISIVLKTD